VSDADHSQRADMITQEASSRQIILSRGDHAQDGNTLFTPP